MHSQPIASVEFSDGTTRLVYEDAHGQYVLDDQDEAWYGVWYVLRKELESLFGDRPMIVGGNNSADA